MVQGVHADVFVVLQSVRTDKRYFWSPERPVAKLTLLPVTRSHNRPGPIQPLPYMRLSGSVRLSAEQQRQHPVGNDFPFEGKCSWQPSIGPGQLQSKFKRPVRWIDSHAADNKLAGIREGKSRHSSKNPLVAC